MPTSYKYNGSKPVFTKNNSNGKINEYGFDSNSIEHAKKSKK